MKQEELKSLPEDATETDLLISRLLGFNCCLHLHLKALEGDGATGYSPERSPDISRRDFVGGVASARLQQFTGRQLESVHFSLPGSQMFSKAHGEL